MQRQVLLTGVCLALVLCCEASFAQLGGTGISVGAPIGSPGNAKPGMTTSGPQPTPVMLLDAAEHKLFILIGDRLLMYSTADLTLQKETRLPAPQPVGRPHPPQPSGGGGIQGLNPILFT